MPHDGYVRYAEAEAMLVIADATDASNNYVEVTCPFTPTGFIVQITKADGTVNSGGQTTTLTGKVIRVAVTALTEGDAVMIMAKK